MESTNGQIHEHQFQKVITNTTVYHGKGSKGEPYCTKFEKWELKCNCGALRESGEDMVNC